MTKTQEGRFNKYVEEVSDERGEDGGVWWYLLPGWKCETSCGGHQIHEDTPQECAKKLRDVEPCNCGECRKLLLEKYGEGAI